jgi:hypothetical protein
MPFKDRLGDRRGEMRFEIIGHLWGALENVERLPLRDIGLGGALVESRLPLAPDSVQAMALRFGGDAVHDVRVRVRHVRPSPAGAGYLVGLEFMDLAAGAAEQIDRYVAASLVGSRPPAEA